MTPRNEPKTMENNCPFVSRNANPNKPPKFIPKTVLRTNQINFWFFITAGIPKNRRQNTVAHNAPKLPPTRTHSKFSPSNQTATNAPSTAAFATQNKAEEKEGRFMPNTIIGIRLPRMASRTGTGGTTRMNSRHISFNIVEYAFKHYIS